MKSGSSSIYFPAETQIVIILPRFYRSFIIGILIILCFNVFFRVSGFPLSLFLVLKVRFSEKSVVLVLVFLSYFTPRLICLPLIGRPGRISPLFDMGWSSSGVVMAEYIIGILVWCFYGSVCVLSLNPYASYLTIC